jgi:hypothetical protein
MVVLRSRVHHWLPTSQVLYLQDEVPSLYLSSAQTLGHLKGWVMCHPAYLSLKHLSLKSGHCLY